MKRCCAEDENQALGVALRGEASTTHRRVNVMSAGDLGMNAAPGLVCWSTAGVPGWSGLVEVAAEVFHPGVDLDGDHRACHDFRVSHG